jgi:probable HAF family extracellular repeat protein
MNDRGVIAAWGGSDGTFVLDSRTGASATLPYFEPRAINNRGQVVGVFDAPISLGGVQGTSWSERDQLQRIPDFVPFAINDHGEMAGNCLLGPDQWGPPCVAVTDQNGQRTLHSIDVGVSAIEARAHDVNDHGEVVGTISYATGLTRAFRWSARDGLLLLEPGSATQSSMALAINNRGLVVGQISDETTFVATEWTWSGEIAAQLTTNSTAIDINDHGIAVVTAFESTTGVFESKVWLPDLGVFELPRPPGSTGVPLASEINNHNQVVGQIESGGGVNYHLVVWNVSVHGKS